MDLEDGAYAPEEYSLILQCMEKKGLVSIDYHTPLLRADMSAYKAAEQAVVDTFGKKPLPFYSGGSIPIISGFERILGIKSLLIGFGLSEDAIHSPNESYGLDQFDKGLETLPYFYKYFAEK